MLNYYGTVECINGYHLYIYPSKNNTVDYIDSYGKWRKAKINLCKWARGFHGNAPSGTHYGTTRLILPNGERVSYKIYV